MNPKRMKEIEGQLNAWLDDEDGEFIANAPTDVADLLRELSAYQYLINNILRNFKVLENYSFSQQLERIKEILTAVVRAHDFGE